MWPNNWRGTLKQPCRITQSALAAETTTAQHVHEDGWIHSKFSVRQRVSLSQPPSLHRNTLSACTPKADTHTTSYADAVTSRTDRLDPTERTWGRYRKSINCSPFKNDHLRVNMLSTLAADVRYGLMWKEEERDRVCRMSWIKTCGQSREVKTSFMNGRSSGDKDKRVTVWSLKKNLWRWTMNKGESVTWKTRAMARPLEESDMCIINHQEWKSGHRSTTSL